MKRHHENAQFGGFDGSARHGVRNVVKFKIQKNPAPHVHDLAHDLRPGGRIQLAADLEHPGQVMEFAHQVQGPLAGADI